MPPNAPVSSTLETERPVKRRRSQPHVAADRAAATVLRPYATRIGDWTTKAAHLSAKSLAHALSPSEREEAVAQVAGLRTEVEAAFEHFRAEIADERPHGRIDDVRRSFERLLASLRP